MPSHGDKQGAAHAERAKWKVGSGMNKKKKGRQCRSVWLGGGRREAGRGWGGYIFVP